MSYGTPTGKEHSVNTEPDKLSSDSEEILETVDYKEAYPLGLVNWFFYLLDLEPVNLNKN